MSISFLLRFFSAKRNRKNANITKGIQINIVVILKGLLFIDINCVEVVGWEFHIGDVMYGNFSLLGTMVSILSQLSEYTYPHTPVTVYLQ